MKLISTEATLDKKRIIFYFTAEKRIDFRELVKDLASKFKTRIEMRQIGVRDSARIVGQRFFSAVVNSPTVRMPSIPLPLQLSIITKTVLHICGGICLYGYPSMYRERLRYWWQA